MSIITQEKLRIFKRLFRGREDVFALHWKSGNRAGYSPAYDIDRFLYKQHKRSGGTLQNFGKKTYRRWSDQELVGHLQGNQIVGIYPLLKDNSSYFIVADFDRGTWLEDCCKFRSSCVALGLHSYIERSKSGNGGHVWIFFEQAYPAYKSRKIVTRILQECRLMPQFDRQASFDRLFPNQDVHSGKGLGNLIALPLQAIALKANNSCFIDPDTDKVPDQWIFLQEVERIRLSKLEEVYNSLFAANNSGLRSIYSSSKLTIKLGKSIVLDRLSLTEPLRKFLLDSLNIPNSEFYRLLNTGRSTWGTKRYFNCCDETENEIHLPRGFIRDLLSFCSREGIAYDFEDHRQLLKRVQLTSQIQLRPYQHPAVNAAMDKDFGVISAPPGTGKTVIALEIVKRKLQPALIIVHRKLLFEQWIERIQTFLNIPAQQIGRIGQGKVKIGKQITVAMIQSLGIQLAKPDSESLSKRFGTVIIDECHHIPASSYKKAISRLQPYYQYGLTATPFRKGSDSKLIFLYIGQLICDLPLPATRKPTLPRLIVKKTKLDFPFQSATDDRSLLSRVLIHDSLRNKQISEDVLAEVKHGRRSVIITERKGHLFALRQYLRDRCETLTISGDNSEKERKGLFSQIKAGKFQVLLTTGQFFGEGTDVKEINCLFLVYPFSFKGKLIQYIGRIQRSETAIRIYDYHDHLIPVLDRQFLKRNRYYRHFAKQATLFDDAEHTVDKDLKVIQETLKIKLQDLKFKFGVVQFLYKHKEIEDQLILEVDHDLIRPEFEVIKPLLSKQKGLGKLQIQVYIEVKQGVVISQLATCEQLELINEKLIAVCVERYRYEKIAAQSHVIKRKKQVLDLEELQEPISQEFKFNSTEGLLNHLTRRKVKHQRQLRFLASSHEASVSPIKFAVDPFAFIFLLHGAKYWHFVLETLDTTEASYIWHFPKTQTLENTFSLLEESLANLRKLGRKSYVEKAPSNFRRIKHDYKNERRGFVVWRDQFLSSLI